MATGYLVCAFDLFDVGDLDLIKQAAERCRTLVVGVFTDHDLEQRYGRRPVVSAQERLAIVEQVRGVSRAVLHERSALAPYDIVFAAAGQAAPATGAKIIELEARRKSSSDLLLRARGDHAVAAVA